MTIKLLIGADPELFTRSRETGQFVSGHGMINGTKKAPLKCNKGALQIDGTALEFNIDPAETCDEFIANIAEVRQQLADAVKEFGVDIVAEPVAEFDPAYFASLPRSALELGCDPDFNAWTGLPNEPPEGDRPFRTGSGHIHIGWCEGSNPFDPVHYETARAVARQLDYYLGVSSLAWDPDPRRRELYGNAGAFRPKSYGMEYRVLSNVWLGSEALQRFVYEGAMKAVTDLMAGKDKSKEFGDAAQRIINSGDVSWADRYDFGTGFKYG